MNEPRDAATLRMTVTCLGLSLALAVLAIGLILAFGPSRTVEHETSIPKRSASAPKGGKPTTAGGTKLTSSESEAEVPTGLWAIAAGLAGALIGLLVPTPRLFFFSEKKDVPPVVRAHNHAGLVALLLLAILGIVPVLTDDVSGSAKQALFAAVGAAAVAIMIPTPARFDPE
jgi:hypothetical protein